MSKEWRIIGMMVCHGTNGDIKDVDRIRKNNSETVLILLIILLSISLMKAICTIACREFAKNSKSEVSLQHFSSQENVLSTIHRFGRTMNFFGLSSGLRTTFSSQPCFLRHSKRSRPCILRLPKLLLVEEICQSSL